MTKVVLLDGQNYNVLKSVTTETMVMIVSTTVVVTVLTTLLVTNRLDSVTEDVNLDILIMTVTKSVHLDIMDWIAENVVTDTVQTMNHVTMSVEYAQLVVRTAILELIVITVARKDILAQTAHEYVHPSVNLIHVDTRTDRVLPVMQVILVLIVPKHVFSLMVTIVDNLAVCNVIITHVTDLPDDVFLVVKMDSMVNCVIETENVIKIQSMSIPIMFILGLSASVLINFILIFCGILLCRKNKSRKMGVSGNLLSCWNRSIYQDIVVKNEEASTYQELNLSGNIYQNTAV